MKPRLFILLVQCMCLVQFVSFQRFVAAAEPETKTITVGAWTLTASTVEFRNHPDGNRLVAIALGNPVRITRSSGNTAVIATAKRVEFDHKKKTIHLKGRPELHYGPSKVVAIDDSTTMLLSYGKKWRFKVQGPHRMSLVE